MGDLACSSMRTSVVDRACDLHRCKVLKLYYAISNTKNFWADKLFTHHKGSAIGTAINRQFRYSFDINVTISGFWLSVYRYSIVTLKLLSSRNLPNH